jgi:hypothetical protein
MYNTQKKEKKKNFNSANAGPKPTKAHLLNEGAGRYLVLRVLIP